MLLVKRAILIGSLLIPVFLLEGCTRPSGVSKIEYLGNLPPQNSSVNILNNLTRSIIYKGAKVEANPMTGTLLQAIVWEDAVKRGLPHDEATNKAKAKKYASRSCFNFYVLSGDSEAANLEYWGVEFEQNDKYYKGQFENPKSPPQSSTYTTATSNYDLDHNLTSVDVATHVSFTNSDVVCLANGNKINYYQEFKMILAPRWDMKANKTLVLTWTPSAPKP